MPAELILLADLERWMATLPRSLRPGERRQCRSCGQQKLLTEFVKDKTKPGGYTRECSLCHAERLRAKRAQAKRALEPVEPAIGFDELRQIARSLEPRWDLRTSKDRKEFETALILLAGVQVGADEQRIAAYTSLPLEAVELRGKNLRANGIWRGNTTYCSWGWDEEEDDGETLIAFWLDCLVADGEIVKLSDEQVDAYQRNLTQTEAGEAQLAPPG